MSRELIKISIQVAGGAISCTPKGGNVHPKTAKNQEPQIQWDSAAEPFTLACVTLDDNKTFWPFIEPAPTKPVNQFVGTLDPKKVATLPSYLKYTITVAGKVLDPIIIVDH